MSFVSVDDSRLSARENVKTLSRHPCASEGPDGFSKTLTTSHTMTGTARAWQTFGQERQSRRDQTDSPEALQHVSLPAVARLTVTPGSVLPLAVT